MRSIRLSILILSLTSFLTACLIDSDEGPTVSLEEIASPAAGVYSLGQPFSVDFTVQSDRISAENVGVAFYLIEASKVDQLRDTDEAEAVEIGEYHIESIENGTYTYKADLVIANDLTESGHYLLVANIDSAGTIEGDSSEEDDKSRDFDTGDERSYASMEIELDYYHDFVLTNLETGNGYLLVPDTDEHDSAEAGIPDTLESDIIGFINATKYGANEDTADISAKVTLGGIDYDVHFWDHINNLYSDLVYITFPEFDSEYYFPFDIALNGELVHALNDSYDESLDENSFVLTLSVNDLAADEVDTTNNSLSIDIPYFVYSSDLDTSSLFGSAEKTSADRVSESVIDLGFEYEYYDDYVQVYGDTDSVAIALFFNESFTFSSIDYSAYFALDGKLTGYLFDESFSIVAADIDADISASTLDGSYDYEFAVLGDTLIEDSDSIYNFDESISKSWDEEVTLVETTFTIVIVPVTVEAGISGSLGIGASLVADEGVITATGSLLSAELDAYASASIDLGIASGGITVDFLIISNELTLTAEADITGFVLDGEVDVSISLEDELKAIEGEFSVYVSYTSYKWCCSFPTKTKTYTIYDTDALYDKTWTLMSYDETLDFF